MRLAYWIALAITAIGGINWAFYGLVGFDAIAVIFGPSTFMARAIYILVGMASVALVTISGSHVMVSEQNINEPKREVRKTRAPRVGGKAKAAGTAA